MHCHVTVTPTLTIFALLHPRHPSQSVLLRCRWVARRLPPLPPPMSLQQPLAQLKEEAAATATWMRSRMCWISMRWKTNGVEGPVAAVRLLPSPARMATRSGSSGRSCPVAVRRTPGLCASLPLLAEPHIPAPSRCFHAGGQRLFLPLQARNVADCCLF